ncbi:MAG TPA: GNAT family N-acetyltransferase [Methanotrichaceae archaeon]|nr:GNAT family N-acetyltransferase [Methanotrichaceae archaeon]
MKQDSCGLSYEREKEMWPEKFASLNATFSHIHPGDRIFIGTGCGEPQYLLKSLVEYVKSNPKAFFEAEVIHVWSLGIAPYADEKLKDNFRLDSFFVGDSTRDAVNRGAADYTPVFLSQVPDLFRREITPLDVALVQTSPPDSHGYMSLGVSVDIVKAAVEMAPLVIAQVNRQMPKIHGDGFINVKDVDYLVPHDEPLLEYMPELISDTAQRIASYVARIIEDGSTIQVGYGYAPNALLSHLQNKKHLGIHTELLTDGIVELMRLGVVDNSQKTVDRGKTVAAFCMGRAETYEYLHDNPSVEFKTIDYTNNPLIISQIKRMTAINSAMEIDLTGQATAESLGSTFYSGIGGQADFMRGSLFAPCGKSILALPSTALGGKVSRIVPALLPGSGVTLTRGDVQYVVTEYGIAYLQGKNIRERAMDLIAIAHPDFQPWLIEEAKRLNLIYKDQAFVPGKGGEYPENLAIHRTTRTGLEILLRPVKISDEPLIKDFFYSLSDESMYTRFISARKNVPHEMRQDFVVVDYSRDMVILAVVEDLEREKEKVVGVGQYSRNRDMHTAEVALVVRDDHQEKGIGSELLHYLTYLSKRQGLLGFSAEVLSRNRSMLRLFEKMGFDIEKRREEGVYELKMTFREV